MTSINDSGTPNQGYYSTVTKDLNLGGWLSCNDKVVLTVSEYFNSSALYVLFYKKMQSCLALAFCFPDIIFCVKTPYITLIQVGELIVVIHCKTGIYTPARP